MKKFFFVFVLLICLALNSDAKQILPDIIENNTIIINAKKTGELDKNYFYCSNGEKCSTELVVREYYKNTGYQVIRAEYSFWKGIFVLAFLDELYPQSLDTKSENKFFDVEKSDVSTEELDKKLKEIEGFKNPTEYFKSPIVQEFLIGIDNKTFCNVIEHISALEGKNPFGTPDYIVWNDKEMIFIEVKRKNEKLSPEQIEWGEF